jgi:ankyrin repeat protein
MVRLLLDLCPRFLSYADESGTTLLHFGALMGQTHIISELLLRGMDPCVHDNREWIPLVYALLGCAQQAYTQLYDY